MVINPDVFNDKQALKEGLKKPFHVIENALVPEFAERLYTDLMQCGHWDRTSIQDPGFTYQRDAILMGSTHAPPSLNELNAFLSSSECLKLITEISGRQCDGFHGAAAVFKPGDQISEHNDKFIIRRNDGTRAIRAVTFNLYLTKNWDERWGGRLIWKSPYTEIVPTFNTLVMFNVGQESRHWVETIKAGVETKRLSISSWFLSALPDLSAATRKLNLKL